MLQCIYTYTGVGEMLKKRKRLATFRLPEWLLMKLRDLDNGQSQAENIETALVETHQWERPYDSQDAD